MLSKPLYVQQNTHLIWRFAFLTLMWFTTRKNLHPSPPWPSPLPWLSCRCHHHCHRRRCPLSPLLFPSLMILPPLRFLLLPRLVDCCLIVVVVAIAATSHCRCWCHHCRFEFIVIHDRCRCCYCRCVTAAASWGVYPPNPGKKGIHLLGGLSSINRTYRRGTKGLMWGARGSFLPSAAMVVMVAVGRWSLRHVSTVGIVYIFCEIN